MSNNKFKTVLASDTFRSIASAVICALVGILVGFIILLIINAEHVPKTSCTTEITAKSFTTWDRLW